MLKFCWLFEYFVMCCMLVNIVMNEHFAWGKMRLLPIQHCATAVDDTSIWIPGLQSLQIYETVFKTNSTTLLQLHPQAPMTCFVSRKPFRAGKRDVIKCIYEMRNEIWKTISAYAALINKWENRKLKSISSFLLQPNAIAWAKYGEKSVLLHDPIFFSSFYSWWMK